MSSGHRRRKLERRADRRREAQKGGFAQRLDRVRSEVANPVPTRPYKAVHMNPIPTNGRVRPVGAMPHWVPGPTRLPLVESPARGGTRLRPQSPADVIKPPVRPILPGPSKRNTKPKKGLTKTLTSPIQPPSPPRSVIKDPLPPVHETHSATLSPRTTENKEASVCKPRPARTKRGSGGGSSREFIPWCDRRSK